MSEVEELLTAIWEAETAVQSSFTTITFHPAFQEIVAMGEAVVPLLLRAIEEGPSFFVWALSLITGAHPVPKADAGNLIKMGEAWLGRAKEKGYQW